MILSIVSLSYNKREMTASFIASLYKIYKSEFEKGLIELIIVDNASSDGAGDYITEEINKNKYRQVYVILNKINEGFAKGCNRGAFSAKGNIILFLNNDTDVEDKGLLEMVGYMEKHSNIAIMGGRMTYTDGKAQLSAWKFYNLLNTVLMLLGFERFGLFKTLPSVPSRVDWVTGGCMMVNKKIFKKVNGFDGNYFMYMEDMDLCFRITKEGFQVYFYPSVNIKHIGQGSSNRTFAIVNIYKGLLYFYKKHMPAWQYDMIKSLLFIKAIVLVAFGKLSNNSYFINTYEQALNVI